MDYETLINELEEQQDDLVGMKPVRTTINQPNLLTVSSVNGEIQNDVAYSSFTVNLPRPMLDVNTLQLLSTNIPQANANIVDNACVFWYYRLSAYSGAVPNSNNLFMVRLLPSYYKQEFITNPNDYGFNRTFKSYYDLATELEKCCLKDLAWTNYLIANAESITIPSMRLPFLPNDISLTYSSAINKFQFTGLPTTPVFVYWGIGTTYAINDIIAYEGQAYKSKQNANVGNYPNTSPAFWDALYSTEVVALWNVNTAYPVGRYVSYKGSLYVSTYTTLAFPPDALFLAWSNSQNYYRGSIVNYLGNTYTAVNSNFNSNPTGLDWVLVDWNYPFAYKTGMVVRQGSNYYVASADISTPTQPSLNSAWLPVGTNFWETTTLPNTTANVPCYNYLSTGYTDPLVAKAQATGIQEWNEYNLYQPGQVVSYNGITWDNQRQSQNEEPFAIGTATAYNQLVQYKTGDVVSFGGSVYIATASVIGVTPNPVFTKWRQQNWVITNNAVPIIGLSAISKQLDMLTTSTYGSPAQTFYALQQPFGIPPQPFSTIPKRILNTILGFTWIGQINPPIYADINKSDTTPLVDIPTSQEYNRLRPVPRYSVTGGVYSGTPLLLGNSSTTYTYTADGFCNLVYSSIISIYTSIAGASTLDTQRDTNLLAIVSMNCSNLGVSFWNNFIDNPLTKVNGSIYSIYLELRDEYGDPYYLTNNAVSTFVFKVGYKENS